MTPLPPEILHEILSYTIFDSRTQSAPLGLLLASSVFRDIASRIIYTSLRFTSRYQLSSFIATYRDVPVPHAPRSIEIDITGDSSNLLFSDIYALFSQCFPSVSDDAVKDEKGRVSLETLRLRTNSHAFDPQIEMVYLSLSLVNPVQFIWTGPDPPHHFSIAIVPQAICHLFRALSTYTNLTHLKLTHLSTPPDSLPIIPSLRTVYLGQAVFLKPQTIANFVLDPSMERLEKVELVDVYKASIWGFRLRRSDIEKVTVDDSDRTLAGPLNDMAPSLESGELLHARNLEIIRKVVICKARTERIMGGDRVEENAILL